MTTKLFYFTGTGNTFYVVKKLAEQLGPATIEPVTKASPVIGNDVDAIGIFFPVYGWGMPKIVRDFVDNLENASGKYVFAVCTYGGTLFASLKSIQLRLAKKGITLNSGFGIRMPVNYIQIFRVLSQKRQDQLGAKAEQKLAQIATVVKNRQKMKIDIWNVPVINSMLLSMNNQMIEHLFDHDKNFQVTGLCNGCGVCVNVCPVSNIVIKNNMPSWNHACQQCLACLHWCPQAAIQYGKVPADRGRYHHPAITLEDMKQQHKAA